MPETARLILVLGMHRSGTSAWARALRVRIREEVSDEALRRSLIEHASEDKQDRYNR